MPSTEALALHRKRSRWVIKMWKRRHRSEVSHPPLKDHGCDIRGNHVSVVWDSDNNRKAIALEVDWIMKGCKCATGNCGPGRGCMKS